MFFNHCLEAIVLKSLINATRLEAVEELWSLIVGYETHDHLLVSSFVIIVSSLCHHCVIIVSSLCHHYVIIVPSLWHHCVIIVSSKCHRCVAIVSSLCHHSFIVVSSFCHHSVIIPSLCVIVSGSWGTSFLRNCTGGHSRPLCGRPGCWLDLCKYYFVFFVFSSFCLEGLYFLRGGGILLLLFVTLQYF